MNHTKEYMFKHFLAMENWGYFVEFSNSLSISLLQFKLSLTLVLREMTHSLMNKNLISQVFIKIFKSKFILICILTIVFAVDTHQSIDVTIASEEVSWTGCLIQPSKMYYHLY